MSATMATSEPSELPLPNNEATPVHRSTLRTVSIVTALYLTLFIAALDQTIVSTAIPTITSSLDSASGYTWIGMSLL